MKILLLDNYDSFTYNLYHYLLIGGAEKVQVFLNDKISLRQASEFDAIVFSPGPGLPNEAGIMPELIKELYSKKSILGICLGHQGLCEFFGGKLYNLPEIYHGVGRLTKLIPNQENQIFKGIPQEFITGRYHSWGVHSMNFPKELQITAIDENDVVMAFQHQYLPISGLQFHPESILTEFGQLMISNWISDLQAKLR